MALLHDVPTSVNPDDRDYAERILVEAGHGAELGQPPPRNFESEIRAVVAVQDAVLKLTPDATGIPFDRERELKDIYELRRGLCYDRSRAMEKIFAVMGLETRHVSIFSIERHNAVVAMILPQTPSHALTEVRTERGWMVIDSNQRWIGLDSSRTPRSLADIQNGAGRNGLWAPESTSPMNPLLGQSFIQVRGLYSRHGRFYPPYTPFPDISLAQLLKNFGE